MPVLTRRRKKGARQESWHIYFGDVQVGRMTIDRPRSVCSSLQ
jgi:hypothetical protein